MSEASSVDEEFRLTSRGEIIAILERLQREGVLTTVEFGDGTAFVASVLEIRREAGVMVFDIARDSEQNRLLFIAEALSFMTELDNIQIAFETQSASPVTYGGRQAAVVDLPTTMMRLQRREWFRVGLPAEPPVRCTVLDPRGNASAARAVDLSCGGAGVVVDHTYGSLGNTGTSHELILNLPEVGRVELDATLRSTLPGAPGKARIGFRFESVPAKTANQLQRYVQRVEVDRLSGLRRKKG